MRTILKTMPYLMALILQLHCDYYDPIDLDPIPNVDIDNPENEVLIVDPNFLKALIERGVDKNEDGIISKDEAEQVSALYIQDENISDLTGIGAFKYLHTLYCDRNPLKWVNIHENFYLEKLSCRGIKVGSMIVWDNPNLKILWCDDCQLSELWLDCNPNLKKISCSKNKLTYLDLSINKRLEYVDLTDMPTLGKVCVWAMPFPPVEMVIDTTGSPNVYFTTECY